jgi:hypothetical protein
VAAKATNRQEQTTQTTMKLTPDHTDPKTHNRKCQRP